MATNQDSKVPFRSNGPLMSIITVCFNARHTIEQTFQSLINQTYARIEYIVVDGGSTDGTLELIIQYKHIISNFVSGKDGGIYEAMNKGIRMANGELIGIINADDFYAPNVLSKVAQVYQANRNLDVIIGNCATVNSYGAVIRDDKPHIDFQRGVVSVLHPSTFVSKQCYLNFGCFDESYRYAGDYDFFCRLANRNANFFHIDTTLAFFRTGGFGTRVGILKEKENVVITYKYWGLGAAIRVSFRMLHFYLRRKFGVFLRRVGLKKS